MGPGNLRIAAFRMHFCKAAECWLSAQTGLPNVCRQDCQTIVSLPLHSLETFSLRSGRLKGKKEDGLDGFVKYGNPVVAS